MTRLLAPALLCTGLCAAALFDLWRGRIPDWITGPVLGIALFARLAQSGFGGERGVLAGIGGVGAALAVAIPVAVWGSLGWGDAKLLAGVGAIFGWPRIFEALLFVSVCGAAQVILATARARGRPPETIPYGLAIAAGSAMAALPALVHG